MQNINWNMLIQGGILAVVGAAVYFLKLDNSVFLGTLALVTSYNWGKQTGITTASKQATSSTTQASAPTPVSAAAQSVPASNGVSTPTHA